jgi:glycosyltransferase involved in cell wall biosynthesis/Tfp pilus assembly protein PilF
MEFGKNKIKHLKRKLKKDPNSYEANLQLGMFYFQHDDIAKAVTYLEKACDVRKDQGELLFILANAYKTLNNVSKSGEYFKKALAVDPDNFEFLYNYGLLLHSSQRVNKTIKIFEKAVKLRPDNYELLNDIGVLCHLQKNYEKAVKFLTKAIEINADYIPAAINLGYVYLVTEDLLNVRKVVDQLNLAHYQDPEVVELKKQLEAAISNTTEDIFDVETELSFSDQLFQITPLKIIKNFGEKKDLEKIGLSIVIPIRNEKENIPLLYDELIDVLNHLKEPYEIIFINDGSTDGSREVLEDLATKDENIKVIQFRRNYGQTPAMNAGFKYARGSVVITLDGDLQNDPADIPRLLEKMAEGYDLVSGWRKNRQDKLVTRKIPSIIANRIINKLIEGTGVQLHDFGCTLKAYKRGIVKNIQLYGEMHRFIPVLFAAWLGVKVAEIPVNHRARKYGVAKYNLSRVSRVIFDLIVVRFFSDYMTRPIQFFGKIAKKLAGLGLTGIFILTCLNLFANLPVSLNTLILLTAILLFSSLQILFAGLLGEIMIRSYFEGQKKDYYVVEKIINDGVHS